MKLIFLSEVDFPLNDGVTRIFLSTKGTNKDSLPSILTDFLGYLENSTDTYVNSINSDKVKAIHQRVVQLKKDRNLEERYMLLDEYIQQQNQEAVEEAKKRGMEKGMEKALELTIAMTQNGEADLIPKLTSDSDFLAKKLAEYHL